MKNTMSYKIATEEFVYEYKTSDVGSFVRSLQKILKEIGELEEDDVLEISSGLSPEEAKILQLAGY
jgi:hypothetical protein